HGCEQPAGIRRADGSSDRAIHGAGVARPEGFDDRHAGEQCHHESKQQDHEREQPPIDGRRRKTRQGGRIERREGLGHEEREPDPKTAARACEHERFREEQLHEAPWPSAMRRTSSRRWRSPRARSRLATLTHAVANTIATIALRASRTGRASRTTSAWKGTTVKDHADGRYVCGYSPV